MPLIRLQRNLDFGMEAVPSALAVLEPIGFDNRAYNYEWRGANGIIPEEVLTRAINTVVEGRDMLNIWICPDHPGVGADFWAATDTAQIMTRTTANYGFRSAGIVITGPVFRLGLANSYDTLGFNIRPKAEVYSITIAIVTLAEDLVNSRFVLSST